MLVKQNATAVLRAACRQMWQQVPLSGELLAWRPSALVSPCQVRAHTWVTYLLAKGSSWQLGQWQETRTPVTVKQDFWSVVWGPGHTAYFIGLPLSSHCSLEPWAYSRYYVPVLPSAEVKGKERLYSLDPSPVLLEPRHVGVGGATQARDYRVRLRAGVHGRDVIVAYVYCDFIACWALAVSHLS